MAAGLLVGVLQAATQVQDSSIAFVPKLLVAALVLAMSAAWIGRELVAFTIAALVINGMNDLLPWIGLVIARLAPFVLITPWLEPVARTLRIPVLAIIGSFALILPKASLPADASVWVGVLGAEFSLGCVLAITFALPFYVFRWLGDLTESLRGAPRTQLPGAQADSSLSYFFHLAALAVFTASGGLVTTLEAFAEYSVRYPIGQPWKPDALILDGALFLLADAFRLLVRAGAPVLATALLLEIVLALIARSAPADSRLLSRIASAQHGRSKCGSHRPGQCASFGRGLNQSRLRTMMLLLDRPLAMG